MAISILPHFPTFISLSSHKPSFNPHFPSPNSDANDWSKCRCCTIVASSIKKPTSRASRKARSVADLCNDIREFLSTAGLPENHVPTTKELSDFGRKDLANVVRRRGYKFIRQLLATSSAGNIVRPNIDTSQTGNLEVLGESEGQNGKQEVFVDVSSNVNNTETEEVLKSTDQTYVSTELNTLSLLEKMAKFIQHGELDEGCGLNITNGEGVGKHERDIAEDSHPYGLHQQQELMISSTDSEMSNGSVPLSVQQIEDPELETSNFWKSYITTAEQTSTDDDKDLTDEKVENPNEIRCLKFLLKELELTQLKGQIEEETLTLSRLQTTAETKISQAHKLISEKETELHVAEETLYGLKEVEIDYSCDDGGDTTVELAGSFNGWDHKITMDLLQPSSSGSRIWRAVLWLYPGVYEIKFIMDGHWRIDPLRESITWNGVHNNILRRLSPSRAVEQHEEVVLQSFLRLGLQDQEHGACESSFDIIIEKKHRFPEAAQWMLSDNVSIWGYPFFFYYGGDSSVPNTRAYKHDYFKDIAYDLADLRSIQETLRGE